MSPQIRPNIVGLAAPGLLWLATSFAFGQDTPSAPPGPPVPASTPPSPGSKALRALLLSNGKVVQGEIVEDAPAGLYRLRQKGGAIGYPKVMVLKAGGSIEDLYRFQVARLPDGDPDERMKLARWCLTEHLGPQAREQLEAIQAMCPDDAEVKRMLYNLASAADPRPEKDAGLRRTSGDGPSGDDAPPATLDPRVINKAQKRFHALPEILDLPQAQAVKRSNEFYEFVHPVLQQSCARCHNEKYQGDFQLVEARSKRDLLNSDIARANLDATIRLVNPDDPTRSELLSAGLVPHGGSKSAIFKGPNDRSYQVLNLWVKSLRPVKDARTAPRGFGGGGGNAGGDGAARTGFTPTEAAPSQGFGSDRAGGAAESTSLPALPTRAGSSGTVPLPRAMVEQFDEDAEFVHAPGDRPEFPAPFVAGGMPAARPSPPKTKVAANAPKKPGSTAAPATGPKAPSPSPTATNPTSVVIEATDDPNNLPGMDQPRYRPKAEGEPGKKAKPIDNALLEKLMKNRNGGTP